MMRIAILGATGHVGSNLVAHLPDEGAQITLVVRSLERAQALLERVPSARGASVATFEDLPEIEVDALVNCVGFGDPAAFGAAGDGIYTLTQDMDDVCARYLGRRPESVLVNFSSGAAYGIDFSEPATDATVASVPLNKVRPEHHYTIAKLASEGRHRALAASSIIDLRLFGLFSRFIDSGAQYLLNDMIRSVRADTEFVTGAPDIVRDFIAPADLASLVYAAASARGVNTAVDVVSAGPVRKSELIESFAERYGMRWRISDTHSAAASTGQKTQYYSVSRRAFELGWRPRSTALEAVLAEADVMLNESGR